MKINPAWLSRKTVESLNHTIDIYSLTLLPTGADVMQDGLFVELVLFTPTTKEEEEFKRGLVSVRHNDCTEYISREFWGNKDFATSILIRLAEEEIACISEKFCLSDMFAVVKE